MDKQEPKIWARRRHQYESSPWKVIVNAPGEVFDRDGLDIQLSARPWREGEWNYTEKEYERLVVAKLGYLHFGSRFWEREPSQEVFDAYVRMRVSEHKSYLIWTAERQARLEGFPDPSPLELPKGTCWLDMGEGEEGDNARWVLTDRSPSFEIDVETV